MQKVFSHCKKLDTKCYEAYHLHEDILMEHAALGLAQVIKMRMDEGKSILIVSGKGNNGADGIALARLLQEAFDVRLFLPFGVKSDMAKLQLKRAKALGITLVEDITPSDVVVDCILGSGFEGELDVSTRELVGQLNALEALKIACDIPTGIDIKGRLSPIAFKADITVTMGAYKEALFLDEAKDSVGEIIKVDLGVKSELYEDTSDVYLLTPSDLSLPSRTKRCVHKGTFGHAVIFCGEKEGAGIISGEAAYRFGAGLTTLVMQDKLAIPPYLMHSYSLPTNTTAIAIGMGLGNHFEESFLDKYIASNSLPLVIDADALYNPKLLKLFLKAKKPIVMTPHPKEFIYMWKVLSAEEITLEDLQANRFEYAKKFSQKFPDIVLVLKGANMLIAKNEKLYINPLGDAKLSKGGSGDVLSGLIVSLLAQGYDALDAAIGGSLALTLGARNYKGASYAMSSVDLIEQIAFLKES
jgi:hydroxyethylthiazole kinase-like uncharacterized protein yjeF